MRCQLCSFEFDPNQLACHTACPLHSRCTVICCPNCGYQVVDASRSRAAGWLRRWWKAAPAQAAPPAAPGALCALLDLPIGTEAQIEAMELPPGYRMEWGGEFESSQQAQESLGKQLPLGFLVMLTISILMFNKVRQPLILWLVVPMSVTGMVLGLLASGMPFTFTALLGFLSLAGMLMKNAIVLVEEIDLRRASGAADYDAVVDGSVSRLRPVVLAAGTTIFGMLPLLPDAFFASMAVTIMGGLAFASVLTLLAVPVLYAILFRIRRPNAASAREIPSGATT